MNPDYDAQKVAMNEIEPNEKLLWAGKPIPSRLILSALPILIFGVPWTVFSLFWECMALGIGSHASSSNSGGAGFSIVFPLFGLPFVLIGFAMLSSPYWAYRKASQTIYAITDQRLLVIVGGFSRKIQSYAADQINNLERRERADGSGDVIFAGQLYASYATTIGGTSGSTRTRAPDIGFIGIRDVRTVERLIRDTFLRS